jgi:hypothetical protein
MKLGSRRCQCAACGQYFGGVSGFDEHRVGKHPSRRCLTPQEMVGIGLTRKGPWWIRSYDGPRTRGSGPRSGDRDGGVPR